MSTKLRIVDPHVHLWELKTGWYPLLDPQTDTSGQDHGVGPFGKLQGSDFLLPDYFGHASGYDVAKIVHVTAAQAPPTWPDETRYLEELGAEQGYPHGIIGWTDFDRPVAEVDAELAAHSEFSRFRGLRHQTVVDYTSDHVLECLGVMDRRGLIYDTVAHEDSLPDAAKAARSFPNMSFVLEHTGWPSSGDKGVFEQWRTGMREFAASPNTAVKISGMGIPLRGYDLEQLRPWVETAIETFGVERCMFASNFPVDWLFTEYSTLFEIYESLVSSFTEDERRAMFADNAERWYRI
ncbi:amidohydrolase family protein [Mycobacterium kyogaense]|uniref:amidohydrolase family protein n=1 Tax=Mycobacterium kyogaense TaxID=2212479 RepID=UPI0013C40886|nr:amidohydrolase family protein [Mycobacterium kyogaense]